MSQEPVAGSIPQIHVLKSVTAIHDVEEAVERHRPENPYAIVIFHAAIVGYLLFARILLH